MNHHHHHHQIPSNHPEQDSSLPASSSGYRRISLPPLRRCISDPYNPPSATTPNYAFEHSLSASRCGGSLCNMTPSYSPDRLHFPKTPFHSPAAVLPPLPPPQTLQRSVSDLNPSPAKTSSRSSTSSQDFHFSTDIDTPNSKRLQRMKGRLREMSLWCQQLMREEDLMEEDEDHEEQAAEENKEEEEEAEEEQVQTVDATDQDFHDNATATAENLQDDGGKEFAESVSVEKKDDCLVIHFRCHCDKAYQFLLSGGDCYYKLM
ncbi:unnamed protein product [Malus baccata var. baccata]